MRPARSRRSSSDGPIDLRSDTVTRPTKQMREAMAAAEVDDDVLGRDPTMRELETRVAGLLGTDDALWTPSGSMGNLIALMGHLRRGDPSSPPPAHVLDAELGTAAWLAGGMPPPLPPDAGPGKVSPAPSAAPSAPGPYYTLRTTLLCLENTHNAAGGTVTAPDQHAAVAAAARAAGLRVHLDGARLWHAAVALGVPPATLTVGADTVQVCFGKGLGAPVGSAVAGSTESCRRRAAGKMLGGGVRQGGVLAAAALVGLDRMERLPTITRRRRLLATGLRERGWSVGIPETNIVLIPVADLGGTLRRFADAGVLASSMDGKVRLMPHADVSRGRHRGGAGPDRPVDPTPTVERMGLTGPGLGSSTRRSGRAPVRRAGR